MKKSILKLTLIPTLCIVFLLACGTANISLGLSMATFDEINNCDSGDPENGTLFTFTIPYEPSRKRTVSAINLTVHWSSGRTDEVMITDFIDTGSVLMYSRCFHYGIDFSFDAVHTVTQDNGKLTNRSEVTIIKPNGANFNAKDDKDSK